jgi:hypothetical protein
MNDLVFLIALLSSFSFVSIIRIFFIKRPISKFLYYTCFLLCVPIGLSGLKGVLDEYYERLDKFIFLEKNNRLEHAKKNIQNYEDRMFRIDLEQFHNSIEFRNYVERLDRDLRIGGCISLGWLFVIVCEILLALIKLFVTIFGKIKKI